MADIVGFSSYSLDDNGECELETRGSGAGVLNFVFYVECLLFEFISCFSKRSLLSLHCRWHIETKRSSHSKKNFS